jgi:hypothetical protein
MNLKQILGLTLVLCAIAAFAVPITGLAADDTKDLSLYFRPAVRFGTDDRTLFIMDFLLPVYRDDANIVFLNTKFTPDTDEAWETNAGLGYRRLVLDDKLVLGGNLFYDHRKTKYGSHFDQIGLGLEAMAELSGIGLTTRLNYYQPLDKAKLGEDFGYVFYGNGIYTAGIEEPMTGFDYEAGVRIPGISNYVETWAYAGGYHYFGSHVPDVNGFSARIEAMPTDFVRLGFEYRNDTINHDEYYGEVALEIPFSITNLVAGKNAFEGIGDVFTGSRSLKERMTEPVHRDVDIVVAKDYLSGPDAAGGEGTFKEEVIFVSDAGTASGTGTFEDPYNTLAAAEADTRLGSSIDLVHVMRGNGTGLAGNDFDTNSAGVTIWGAGATNPAYPYVANLVPGWPLVTSTLTMNAQHMTVMGLYVNNGGGTGIAIGEGATGAGLTITGNKIHVTDPAGINASVNGDIGAAGDPVLITNNTITAVSPGNNTAGISLLTGDFFTARKIYASIVDNIMPEISSAGGTLGTEVKGIYLYGSGGVDASILNNRFNRLFSSDSYSSLVNGIYIDTFVGPVTGSISGNTLDDVSCAGASYRAVSTGIRLWTNRAYSIAVSDNTMNVSNGTALYSGSWGVSMNKGNSSPDFGGSITGNHIFVDGASFMSACIYLNASGESGRTTTITTAITGNELRITNTAPTGRAYGLYAVACGSTNTLGTLSSPLVFTGNYGEVNASTAYAAYLDVWTNYAGSNVFIGPGTGGMGDNSFTTTGTWSGNYPSANGPIWATGGGIFIHP